MKQILAKMKYKEKSLLLMVTSIIYIICTTYAYSNDLTHMLVLKDIHENANCKREFDYEPGANKLTAKGKFGLPMCFTIHTNPDLTISNNDIKRIIIKSISPMSEFGVNKDLRESYAIIEIYCYNSISEKLYKYTESRVHKHIAIER